MNDSNDENVETEGILRQVRPLGPSNELKGRILQAAQDVWRDTATNIPWRVPIGRLVGGAMAAAVVISLANLYADHICVHRLDRALTAEHTEPCDLDVLAEPHASFLRCAVAAGRQTQEDAAALFDYLKTIRETLAEAEQDDAPDGPDPMERRSRLLPIPSILHS